MLNSIVFENYADIIIVTDIVTVIAWELWICYIYYYCYCYRLTLNGNDNSKCDTFVILIKRDQK